MKKLTLMMMITSTTILMANPATETSATSESNTISAKTIPTQAAKTETTEMKPAAQAASDKIPVVVEQQRRVIVIQKPNMQRAGMQGQGMGQGAKGMMTQGKCGQGMQKMHGQKMKMQGKRTHMMRMKHMQKMHSPFLIKQGLPHMSKMIMQSWGDPAFALTDEQKSALETVRKNTMGSVMALKKEILPLTKSIIAGTYSGKSSDELKEDVKKLGDLEAEATIVHIKCIEETKKILTKDQLVYLLQKSAQHGKMHKMR